MELQKVKDWVDLILKVIAILAIISFGAWAYYQYWMEDIDASNVQLAITTEVLKYSDDNRLLVIHLQPKNIGKVPVTPKQLLITIKDLPGDLKPGVVDFEKLKERYSANLLEKFKGSYDLEPGINYDEVVTMIVPRGVYSVRGEVAFEDDDAVNFTAIVRAE